MIIGAVGILYLYPNPAFSHTYRDGAFIVRSDRPIDPAIHLVLEDSARRLKTSSLYRDGEQFRLFICNDSWRLGFFALNPSIGGGTMYGMRNIFIREADIAANRIVSPSRAPLLDARDRPMSYFIAHEATHVLELRRFGELTMLRSPVWLVEGYADLVAKAGDFDVAANRDLLNRHDPLLGEPLAQRGLYRRYHLMVAALLRNQGTTIDRLFATPPAEDEALRIAARP